MQSEQDSLPGIESDLAIGHNVRISLSTDENRNFVISTYGLSAAPGFYAGGSMQVGLCRWVYAGCVYAGCVYARDGGSLTRGKWFATLRGNPVRYDGSIASDFG